MIMMSSGRPEPSDWLLILDRAPANPAGSDDFASPLVQLPLNRPPPIDRAAATAMQLLISARRSHSFVNVLSRSLIPGRIEFATW